MTPLESAALDVLTGLTDEWSAVGDVSATRLEAVRLLTELGLTQLRGTCVSRLCGFPEVVTTTLIVSGRHPHEELARLAAIGFPGSWFDADGKLKGRAILDWRLMEDIRLTAAGMLARQDPEGEWDAVLPPTPRPFVEAVEVHGGDQVATADNKSSGGRAPIPDEVKVTLLEEYEAGKAAGRWATQQDFADEKGMGRSTVSEWLKRARRSRDSENVRKTTPN